LFLLDLSPKLRLIPLVAFLTFLATFPYLLDADLLDTDLLDTDLLTTLPDLLIILASLLA